MTKERAGKKAGVRESQAAATRDLQFAPLPEATAQRQLLGYSQRGLTTQRSKSSEGRKGDGSIFLTLPIFLYWVQSTSFHLLIHC